MKILYALFSAAVVAIGMLHMATTFRLSGTPVSKIWFFGAGMAMALAGVLNILNRQYGLVAFGLRTACITTNVVMLCFAFVAGHVTSATVTEQVIMLTALASALILSATPSASIGSQSTRGKWRLPMKLDRIHQIAVYARDLDEAISFYRDTLGARYLTKFNPPGLAFLDFSGVRVLLEKDGPKATMYFRVEDIDSAYAELVSKGVKFVGEPHLIFRDDAGIFGKPGEEEWMAFFSDPSGNILALATRRPGRE